MKKERTNSDGEKGWNLETTRQKFMELWTNEGIAVIRNENPTRSGGNKGRQ